jgi:hypothetical protein
VLPVTDAEELKHYFDLAINEMELPTGWKVVVDKKGVRRNISVAAASRKVYLPGSEELSKRSTQGKLTPEKIRGLIVHELGTHGVRRENGLTSRLQLLSLGLDRYEEGEEGLATYREEQETGASDYAGFDNYLAAGLAKGLDGESPRAFAGVHSLLKDYYMLTEPCDANRADELAWNRCMRIFRGTPGNLPGIIFPKDIIYREGSIATYTIMNEDGNDAVDYNVGKFNHANPRHIQLLTELGIIDSDLARLEAEETQEVLT